jgi:hypothetical protein
MEDKHPGGRPTDYRAEYCDQVIEWGAQGKSKAWMAAKLGVTRQTLDNWMGAQAEFFDAMTRARDLAQAWWEDKGQDNIVSLPGQGTLNAGVYSRSMAARFPEDWREKTETALTGANGGPIEHTLSVSDSTGRLLAELSGIGANRQPAPPVSD